MFATELPQCRIQVHACWTIWAGQLPGTLESSSFSPRSLKLQRRFPPNSCQTMWFPRRREQKHHVCFHHIAMDSPPRYSFCILTERKRCVTRVHILAPHWCCNPALQSNDPLLQVSQLCDCRQKSKWSPRTAHHRCPAVVHVNSLAENVSPAQLHCPPPRMFIIRRNIRNSFSMSVKKKRFGSAKMTPVGFEPTPFRNGALSHRLRPLGQSVLGDDLDSHSIVHCSSCRTP